MPLVYFSGHSPMRSIVIIPARYSSTRLPGKPLLRDTGKYLIEHTYEAASKCAGVAEVLVATDDERIAAAVRDFGGKVVMTSPDHRSGTDRIAEAAAGITADLIINLQGDEPDMPPEHIEALIELFEADAALQMATLGVRKSEKTWLKNPNDVKVIVDDEGIARDFSRLVEPSFCEGPDGRIFKHLGIYGYRRDFLREFVSWPPSKREESERLEQLRAVDNGVVIRAAVVAGDPVGIDTEEDYAEFVRRFRIIDR